MNSSASQIFHYLWYGYFRDEISQPLSYEIEKRRLKGEKVSTLVLVSFVVTLLILWFFSPRGHNNEHVFSTIPTVTALYFPFLLFRTVWSFQNRMEEGAAILFTMVDICLVLATLWLFPIEYDKPSTLYLKAPTFYFLYVIIALRVLSFRPGLILKTLRAMITYKK